VVLLRKHGERYTRSLERRAELAQVIDVGVFMKALFGDDLHIF
jgi:hypothetical protein